MSERIIRVCDDVAGQAKSWVEQVEQVQDEFEVQRLAEENLREEIKKLEGRREAARIDGRSQGSQRSLLDSTAILIVDYDLLKISKDYRLTGENVAYLARCYSGCGLILVVNQFHFGEKTFDLSLRGHPESFADLNLSSEFLSNKGLWSDEKKMFRPWSWPILPRWLEKYEARLDEVRQAYDGPPILEFLGLRDFADQFPRSALEFLSDESPKEATFKHFVERSGNGRQSKDQLESPEQGYRIAASRIAQWLDSIVLPGQDILVDAPHLVSRFSSLFDGKDEDWDRAADLRPVEDLPLKRDLISAHRFKKEDWISRPAWMWLSLSSDESIPEVREPWSSRASELVFCEDTSRFIPRNEAQMFVADLDSAYDRRFIEWPDKTINYRPRVRFSL